MQGGSVGEAKEGIGERSGDLKADLIWRKKDQRKEYGGALVGKMITEKNVNKIATVQMIRKGWNLEKKEDLEIIDVDRNAFIFEFRRKDDCLRILRGRPWSIQGVLLNIQVWQEYMVYKEVDFNFCPFWIQLQDLPLEGMDVENAKTLGSMIGEVAMVEDPRAGDGELLVRSFLRVRVVVDLRKPLISGMWIPRPDRDPTWIKAKYERLQNFCYRCGRIGHDQRVCSRQDEEEDSTELPFGSWLSVQVARPMDIKIKCCKEGWEEFMEEKNKEAQGKKASRPLHGIENSSGKEWIVDNMQKINSRNKGIDTRKEDARMVGKKGIQEDTMAREEVGRSLKNVKEHKVKESMSESKVAVAIDEKNTATKSPITKVDLSRAIVVYGDVSPISEVTKGLRKIGLKRRLEKERDESEVKKRRLKFDENVIMISALEDHSKLSKSYERRRKRTILKGIGRRIVKNVKRMEEGPSGGMGEGGTSGKEDEVELVVKADGVGGWPQSATKEQ